MANVDWPEITILLCTFERQDELQRTIDALREHLTYPADRLKWIICDDSSPSNFAGRLAKRAAYHDLNIKVVKTDKNSGWGVNVNNGLAHVETDLTFFIEDDYVLTQPLDLRIGVALLMEKPFIGMLRYRGTAGEHIVLHQMEAHIENWLPEYRDGIGLLGRLQYCLLDSGSPALCIYSHGAHLKRQAFHEFYGLYPEGLRLGATEEAYAHNVKNKMKEPNSPPIAILPGWIINYFDHIGQSRQYTELDTAGETHV
jgi:glycosyltransferase involved in cell wall biosynthesis